MARSDPPATREAYAKVSVAVATGARAAAAVELAAHDSDWLRVDEILAPLSNRELVETCRWLGGWLSRSEDRSRAVHHALFAADAMPQARV